MIEIIPAMDLIDGKCVRLSQGDFSQSTIYSSDPVQVAKEFANAGLRRLHIVDLDGAKRGRLANLHVLERITNATEMTIDFGGGIKTVDDLKAVFDAGAAMASVGSVAIKEPFRFFDFLETFGSERILLGADVRNRRLTIDGWLTGTDIHLIPFLAEQVRNGISRVFVTDVMKDGTLRGPAVTLYREIVEALPALDLIASGGVSSITDIRDLEQMGCRGVILGKAIYEGRITLDDLATYGT